jgi:hypothetical protein
VRLSNQLLKNAGYVITGTGQAVAENKIICLK